jgi:hypothetical protein
MIIEMLLNNDIQKNICSNDYTLSKKEIYVIMYIFKKTFKLYFNHFI